MGKPLKPNVTYIPNIIFDEYLDKLNGAELKVLFYIARRTYGFHKPTDKISYSQFQKGITTTTRQLDVGTGLARTSISKAIQKLIKLGLVTLHPEKVGIAYSINIDSSKKLLVAKSYQSRKATKTGSKKLPPASSKTGHTNIKKRNKGNKDNTNVLAKAKQKPVINEMFNYWKEQVGYEITSRQQANRYACNNLLKKHGEANLKKLINGVAIASNDKYAPRISDFADLQSKFNALILWGKKQSNKGVLRV